VGRREGADNGALFTSSQYLPKALRFGAVRSCAQRMSEVAGLPLAYAEAISLTRYTRGQQYHFHVDSAYPHLPRYGQRHLTAIAYLSDTPDGGETVFPLSGSRWSNASVPGAYPHTLGHACAAGAGTVRVAPHTGSCVVFRNHHSASANTTPILDRCSLHAACPVLEGEKWIAQLWLHREPWQDDSDGTFW